MELSHVQCFRCGHCSAVFLSSLICLIKVNTLVVEQRKHTRTHFTHFLCCNNQKQLKRSDGGSRTSL